MTVLEAAKVEYVAAPKIVAARPAALRSGTDEPRTADVLCVGQDAWFGLVAHRWWSSDHAERWLATEAKRALLASPA